MSQVITATFMDGILRPDANLDLAAGTRVQLIVTPCAESEEEDPLSELDRLCEEEPIDSGGLRLTREQLYDRN